MANLSLIRDICSKKNITLKELAGAIQISQNGIQRIIKENSTKIETLENIADYLKVPVNIFFTEDFENDLPSEIAKLFGIDEKKKVDSPEIKLLKERIRELEEKLEDKKEIIRLLKETEAVSAYNITTPKKERGLDYNLDLNDFDALKKDLLNMDIKNPSDQDEIFKLIEKKIKNSKK